MSSTIESVLVENRVFPPDARASKGARIDSMAAYDALCKEAADDFEGFWARQAKANVVWTRPFTRTLDESQAPFYKWFDDGVLNVSYNCLDRKLRSIAKGEAITQDVSTLENPAILDQLKQTL